MSNEILFDNLFSESNHNDFVITDEITDYARIEIYQAIEFLVQYLQGSGYNVEIEKTYEIPTLRGIVRITSFDTKIYKNDARCVLEVSNPLYRSSNNYNRRRFWATFNIGRKVIYWTNEARILEHKPNPIWLFNIFSKNYYSVWEKYEEVRQRKLKGDEISAEDAIFSNKSYDDLTADG